MSYKKAIARLWSIHPTIHSLLKDTPNPINARKVLLSYITEMRRLLNQESRFTQPLEFNIQHQCLMTFRKIISTRSERITKFNLVRLLWALAHEKTEYLPPDLNNGFFEELTCLFLGIRGESGIYDKEPYPEFTKSEGRQASIIRSNQLDKIAQKCTKMIKSYPSGLDSSIQEIRSANRRRIMEKLNASDNNWNDYKWHFRHVIRNADQLSSLIQLTPEEKEGIRQAKANRLPFGITPYYVSLMDEESSRERDHAIRAQVIPPLDYVKAMQIYKKDLSHFHDFMLEHDTSPIDLITRRYPAIVILKPYNSCSQICVYCQRNWEINDALTPKALASKVKLDAAIDWIRNHKTISEVLVTGGDPLVMNDKRIDSILHQLSRIRHIDRIRIGSRMPVVLPQRITDALIEIIAKYHEPGKREMALVTHYEHAYEVTPESMKAIQQFKKKGVSAYNQAVFTIENSRRFELVALRRALRLIGVDPYYTFNIKGKEETESYRVPMARLQQEIKEEARLTPGLARTDEPVYNVPGLGKNYIRAQQHHSLLTILPNGRRVYEFHPWEKKLSLAKTFIDTDVSIYDYLQKMKKRGENPEDYKSIWYYY